MATQTDAQGRVMVDVQDQNATPRWTPDGDRLPGPMSQMNAGTPATTTENVPDRIPSQPDQAAAPSATKPMEPNAPPTKPGDSFVQDKAGGPLRNADTPQSQPHPMSKIFDSMLKMASGGPIYVNDPVTGQRREVPQTRGSMARAITAAALSGLFTPNQYRPGPFGGSVLDRGETMAAAGRAGMESREKREQFAQQSINDANTRRMATLQNNVKFAVQMAALTHQKQEQLDQMVAVNTDKFIKPIQELDGQRQGDEPSYFTNRGLTDEELLKAGHKWTDNNVFVDGTKDRIDPSTGMRVSQPTYAVIRTTDKDGKPLMLKLPEEVTKELGKFSKPYEQSYDLTKGNVMVPINNYMDAIHTYHTLNSVEAFMNRAQKDINPKGKPLDMAAAFKADPNGMWAAVKEAEQAIGAGNGRPGEDTDDYVIRRVGGTPGGAKLLDMLGTPQQIETWSNGILSRRKLAESGGIGDKAPAPKEASEKLLGAVESSDLPDDEKKALLSDVPQDRQLTNGQMDKLRGQFLTATANTRKEKIQTGDPTMINQQVTQTIGAGDMSDVKSFVGMRSGQVRDAYNLAFQHKAEELGLNPSHYTMDAIARKDKTMDAYRPDGKVGQQLAAFKKFAEHASDAKEANDAWARIGSPLLTKPYAWLEENATNDQNFQRFKDSVIAPAKEYLSFLNQNRAEHDADARTLEGILSPKATPQSIFTALQTFMKTADDQTFTMGEQYRDAVGTTYPGLLTKSTADAMQKLLGKPPRSAAVSGTLPRAPSFRTALTFQTLNPSNPGDKDIAKRFYDAAGKDISKATEMAREHGYVVSYTQNQ